jgi:hypothetical protein
LWLASAAAEIKTDVRWADLLKAATEIERTDDRNESLVGILAWMTKAGEYDLARRTLTTVVDTILDGSSNWLVILHLGRILAGTLQLTLDQLHTVIESVMTQARAKDRPSVLTWIAALLPAIARVDSDLAANAWDRVERADAMLRD